MDKILESIDALVDYCRKNGMNDDPQFERMVYEVRSNIVLKGRDIDKIVEMIASGDFEPQPDGTEDRMVRLVRRTKFENGG